MLFNMSFSPSLLLPYTFIAPIGKNDYSLICFNVNAFSLCPIPNTFLQCKKCENFQPISKKERRPFPLKYFSTLNFESSGIPFFTFISSLQL